MGLTPEEVRDVTFPRPPWFRRGYHEDSVDAFLDHVTAELTRMRVDYRALARLSEENHELRQQLAERAVPRTVDLRGHDGQRPTRERPGLLHYAGSSD